MKTSLLVPTLKETSSSFVSRKRLFKSGGSSSYIGAIGLIILVSGYKNYVEAATTGSSTSTNTSSYGVVDFLIDLGMVFAPTIGYFDQIRLMIKNQDSKAFSRFISLILLSSNLLRIFFWYLKQFSMVMLFQSIVMILCQLVTLFVAVKYGKEKKHQSENERNDNENPSALMDRENPRDFTSLIQIDTNQFLDRFWKWDDFSYYLWTNLFFVIFVFVISLFFYPIFPVPYTELLGMLSVTIEALLAIPQVITNFQNGSTEGLSLVLIGTFVIGDSLKTAYFVFKQLPYQFVFCGAFQIFVDMIMVIQMIYYNFVAKSSYANNFQEIESIGELEEEEEEEINLESEPTSPESKDQVEQNEIHNEEPIILESTTQDKTENVNKESESV